MAKENKLTYEGAMARVESIVSKLEQSEAISLDEYKQLASECQRLLAFCKQEITGMSEELIPR